MILVDTSVWVDHLRRPNAPLVAWLELGEVSCHPFVVGEIGLGSLKHRARVLSLLAELPMARTVRHEDAMALVQERALSGVGLGWVDVHLLASAFVEGWGLWTIDRQLHRVADRLGIAHESA